MNRTQLEVLRNEITQSSYDNMIYEEIAAALNQRTSMTEPNPDPQQQIARRVTMQDVLATVREIDPSGCRSLLESQGGGAFIQVAGQALQSNDVSAISGYLAIASDYVLPEAVLQVSNLMTNPPTIPDPDWQAEITTYAPSRAEDLGLSHITERDVQAALHMEV